MTVNKNEVVKVQPEVFTFNSSDQPMRGFCIDGEPYFVAKDICDILDLSNPSMTIQSLDEDERAKYCLGRQGETWCVNESGLYHLIFQSRKPEAKAFRRKVTMEILPTLRRTGRYEVKPQRWSQRYERPKDVVDMRTVMYEHSKFDGHPIRAVRYDGSIVYSVADMLRAMKVGTSAYQAVASLAHAGMYVVKIHFCGSPHPTWCTTHLGLLMLLRSTRNPDLCQRKFDFSSVQ